MKQKSDSICFSQPFKIKIVINEKSEKTKEKEIEEELIKNDEKKKCLEIRQLVSKL